MKNLTTLLAACLLTIPLRAALQPTAQPRPATVSNSAIASMLGVELDGLGDGSRSMPFVDLAKTLRPFTRLGKDEAASTDANGWPTSDCQTVLFDIRPIPAWNPPIDDPEAFQPDWSGTYKLSLSGQAVISVSEGGATLSNCVYNTTKNITTADILVPKRAGLLVMAFRNTARTNGASPGSGFTGLRVIRPGYPADTQKVFTDEFLKALRPFSTLRFMDWLSSNHNPGYYGDAGHHALEWKDRRLPTDATQQDSGASYGVAWEYVVELANASGKDIWINIPVAATDDYVKQLAAFLKATLKPNIRIYLEHSNEVWNYGFPQYIYNKLAAIDDVKRNPASMLRADKTKDEEVLACRRHAARLHSAAQTFATAFGQGSLLTRIRPVYASWFINPDSHYRDVLQWMNEVHGAPTNYLYAIASAAYYNAEKAAPNASPEAIVAAMKRASDDNRAGHLKLKAIADRYGLKYAQYEVGPDTGGGSTQNVANRIRANRLPEMGNLVSYDAHEWFAMGGDLYMYFAMPGTYSRYGCWGLSEDIRQLDTPKWRAIYQLTGSTR
jgi:hypothetical protein